MAMRDVMDRKARKKKDLKKESIRMKKRGYSKKEIFSRLKKMNGRRK